MRLGFNLLVFRGKPIIRGKELYTSPSHKCRGISCDRASSTALPLMESADCRKNGTLLSKFNVFMKINVFLLMLLLVRIHLILPFL